jgi:hypothetical protein
MIKLCEYTFCSNAFETNKNVKRFCSVKCRVKEFEETTKTILVRLPKLFKCPHCNQEIDIVKEVVVRKLIKENKK